jgi:hypothetical protein
VWNLKQGYGGLSPKSERESKLMLLLSPGKLRWVPSLNGDDRAVMTVFVGHWIEVAHIRGEGWYYRINHRDFRPGFLSRHEAQQTAINEIKERFLILNDDD